MGLSDGVCLRAASESVKGRCLVHLTPPSSGRPPAGCAGFRSPLMSNVRRHLWTRQRKRQASRRSPETAVADGVRSLAEPFRPITVQEWFIDGLDTLDIWIDVPAGEEDIRLTCLLEELRQQLIASFLEIHPPWDCSLVLSRNQQGFGSVQIDRRRPEAARLFIHSEIELRG